MKENQIRELVNELRDIAIEYHGTQQLRERIARTVRAALHHDLEKLNQPVSQTYELPELIEGMEVSIDVSTCDADAGNRYFGTVTEVSELDTAKNGYILLVQDAEPNFDVNGNSPVIPEDLHRAAMLQDNQRDLSQPVDPQVADYEKTMLQAGNSPVTPGGWISCSERMPEDEQEVIVHNKLGYRYVSYFDEHSGLFFDMRGGNQMSCIEHILVTHWMPLPAAPEPEQS
ncbi:TPA: DUF551 domain-containing protein [Salmonella enterica subsp. enterica serovar Havana]